MAHSLINVFSQIVTGGNEYVQLICRIVIIVLAVVIADREASTVG